MRYATEKCNLADSIAELDGRWPRRCAAEAASIEAGSWYAWRPKPQPTRPNPARDPEFRNDPRAQPTARSSRHATWEAIPSRGGALIAHAGLNRHRPGLVFAHRPRRYMWFDLSR